MGMLVLHVLGVSALMVIGKLFPVFCYRDEASFKTRLALSLGMCPRGEVGAGVIVISFAFGITGQAITVGVLALALNLMFSSVFIMAVKALNDEGQASIDKPEPAEAEMKQLECQNGQGAHINGRNQHHSLRSHR